jgi:hypothetical protein
MKRRIHQVLITDSTRPEERYIAFSIEAALPEHRSGYAQAVAANQAVQIDTTTYQPVHASQEEI